MKMNLAEVLMTYGFLQAVSGKRLPVRMSYAVSKNLKKLEEEKDLIEKTRVALNEQYCQVNEEGIPEIENGSYIFNEENLEKFNIEFGQYLETETEIEVQKIPSAELWKLEERRYDALSPDEITHLEFMFEEE